jgi:homoserine O-acetyltransferase
MPRSRPRTSSVFLTLFALALLTCRTFPAYADGAQQIANLGTCKLDSGKQIESCQLGYRTFGKLNADASNAVLFPTWFSGTTADIVSLVGTGKDVDPSKYFVLAVDALGDGVSSSPSNSKTQPRMKFPAFTIRDMVHAEYRLATETLHLKHLHAVMGISMGGMQTFEWMVDYPDFMDRAIPIVGSTRLTAYDLLLWHAEEDAIHADPGWHGGNYEKNPSMPELAILHTMNLSTPSGYNSQVSRDKFAATYAGYGPENFDINNWLYQLEAMIHHDVAHGGSMADAAKKVRAKVLVIPSQQDHMVNPAPAIEFAKLIGAKVFLLTSDCGHIAFTCETERFNPAVSAFLDAK